jgi:hypothetical protein
MSGKLKWRRYIKYSVIKAGNEGLLKLANNIYTASQKRVPLDDGELSLGARIFADDYKSERFRVAVSYGNGNVSDAYAVIQHENLSYQHKPGEQAKFLEQSFEELKDEADDYVGYSIKAVL